MSVTVEDLMRLPSLRQAKVIGGSGGMRRVVSSISVLESTKPEILVNELFPDARSGYSGGELVITGFINCTDDVEMQCENVRRLIEGGEVGLVLYYVGVYLPRVDQRLIAHQLQVKVGILDGADLPDAAGRGIVVGAGHQIAHAVGQE